MEFFSFGSFVAGGMVAVLVSGMIRTMPKPAALNNNIWYKWFYDFAQFVLANADLSGWTSKVKNPKG